MDRGRKIERNQSIFSMMVPDNLYHIKKSNLAYSDTR
jgi:hypothetical protein